MRKLSPIFLASCAFVASPLYAADEGIADDAVAAETADEIVVFGRGETRQV